MNESVAFCPECRATVETVQFGNRRVCSRCGLSLETIASRGSSASDWKTGIVGALSVVLLIVVTLVVVGVGVLFVGCAQFAKDF
jgi:hypothetical protein